MAPDGYEGDDPSKTPDRATGDGPDAAPDAELLLDPGHDDYFEHGNAKCWDIARHPAWSK
ncbi:MAG TPA: hypothetical protein VGL92_15440 [Acidimicrobiia bacterium]|jgi:hypothetical protein